MEQQKTRQEALEKLREMIRDIDFGMLTTVDEEGCLRSRPMSTNGQVESNGDLWFFTYGTAPKVAEIQRDPRVNVSYADPEHQRYISLSGQAELVRDRAKIEELWQPALKAWFPGGKDEPDIALLRITVEKAEYWDSPSSLVASAISMVKAVATGTPADPGDHQKLDLAGAHR